MRAEAIAAAAAAGTATSEEELEALAAVEAPALWRNERRPTGPGHTSRRRAALLPWYRNTLKRA